MFESTDQKAIAAAINSGLESNRRSFIGGALLAIGVAGVGLSGCNALTGSGSSEGPFFSTDRFAVLDAAAETIMPRTDTPGARDAKVPQRFDALMTGWASPKSQKSFTSLLDEIDAAAKSQAANGLAALPAEKQLEVISAFDTANMANPEYMKFKNLVLALYYLSEPGATEELRYEHVPGAWEPSIPVTADTRAYSVDVSF